MVSGRGKAATHLNSWSRCLDREDGIHSPASLSSLTAVACTKSWSQMAARWKSIRRRTGETTVRIFIATRPVNRNWVRNPISASLPSDVTCALHSYSTDFDVWDIMCSDAKQLISMERRGREMAPCSSPKANSGSWRLVEYPDQEKRVMWPETLEKKMHSLSLLSFHPLPWFYQMFSLSAIFCFGGLWVPATIQMLFA